MNTKLHAICDSQGRPLNLFVTAGQVSDYIGARALLSSLPKVDWLLGDRGYDADWFRDALKDKGIRACMRPEKLVLVACHLLSGCLIQLDFNPQDMVGSNLFLEISSRKSLRHGQRAMQSTLKT